MSSRTNQSRNTARYISRLNDIVNRSNGMGKMEDINSSPQTIFNSIDQSKDLNRSQDYTRVNQSVPISPMNMSIASADYDMVEMDSEFNDASEFNKSIHNWRATDTKNTKLSKKKNHAKHMTREDIINKMIKGPNINEAVEHENVD